MIKFSATALRWYSDEPQPGILEVSVVDVSGREHLIREKWMVILPESFEFGPDVEYPFRFTITAQEESTSGDDVVVTLPWSMETTESLTKLTLSRSVIQAEAAAALAALGGSDPTASIAPRRKIP
jgi:hypothetical protein